ncbi:UNVERIFIED_CONTAM: hypothetical protein GTU68_057148, partial [Idotea baltica]|nr:hypothetical protein [Idotea baltica]
MSKKSSKDIFTSIAESLRLNVANSEREIVRQIEKALTTSKVPIILILDEVDQLESKDQ